jgi:hypothetical protein
VISTSTATDSATTSATSGVGIIRDQTCGQQNGSGEGREDMAKHGKHLPMNSPLLDKGAAPLSEPFDINQQKIVFRSRQLALLQRVPSRECSSKLGLASDLGAIHSA